MNVNTPRSAHGIAFAPPAAAPNGADNGANNGATMAHRQTAADAAAGAAAPIAPCPPVSPEGHGGQTARAGTRRAAPGAARISVGNGAGNGARNGAENGAPDGAPTPSGQRIDAEYVIYRLEESGRTLLALPQGGYSTRMRTSTIEMVRSALEGYGWANARGEQTRLRPAVPDAGRISRMDEAMGWIPLIPVDRYVLRRIVGARSLVSPVTERHLFPWRRLGMLLGADHKAVQRWHAQGIDMIVAALNARRR